MSGQRGGPKPRPRPVGSGAAERIRTMRDSYARQKMTPWRLWRRLLLVAVITAGAVFSARGPFQRASDAVFGARVNWHSDYAMTTQLYDLIVSRRLTPVRRECLLLNIHGGDPPQATVLDVWERPTPACLGPARNSLRVIPTLFRLRVDREAGTVETDSGTPGVFHHLAG